MSKQENQLQTEEPTVAARGTDGDARPDEDGDRAEADTASAEDGSRSEAVSPPDRSSTDRPGTSGSATESATPVEDERQQADPDTDPVEQDMTVGAEAGDETGEETARAGEDTGVAEPADDVPDDGDSVLDVERAAEIRRRVREATGAFIDQPRHTLEEMDTLFDEVSTLFTEGLAARRAGLRRILEADDSASGTEELRLAVREYRHLVEVLIEA